MVSSPGQMVACTKDIGTTVNNTVKESITQQKVKLRKASGKRVKELDGYLNKEKIEKIYLLISDKWA